ncbi:MULTISPECIES: ribosomal protein S18-alanine N-acetyltransferase [unclassified Roseateles]|uniref:ribosomal protein S18-alanine N-acetyltransferase n=1 Tax=unclassified Roseateles TaxID=2626991 RepID=UPI0022B8D8F0|nr:MULTISPECIES: ribosomal protein S18-alanine N-acetyltransferase [unclassified Roseateles]MCZ7880147.1 ribosomal protein S18-alanine N-acetyltransferase [Paucibacter sp. M5-1]MDC6169567.1 ribosomal protein S18-alanine N-acetyltransferase [Paucibacter sp. XJ19-41]
MRGEVMSPVGSRLQAMQAGDVEAVLAIEQRAYEFPWSRGNFIDSLSAGYLAQVLRAADGSVLGYFLAMQGVDELHLLNITVLPECQGQGLARLMLDALQALAREHGGAQIWLEVRQGNERARRVYARYGFAEVGLRRAYYPAAEGRREDAVLMSLRLAEGAA